MLVQLPSRPAETPDLAGSSEPAAFQEALRRDLSRAPVVAYDEVVGRGQKRAFDLALTLLTLPVWGAVLFFATLRAKLRHRGRAIVGHERVGYGGRAFRCLCLRRSGPSLVADAEDAAERDRPGTLLERLPQLFNVLRGQMSLVGPVPLALDQIEGLKSAQRFYLSARPGVFGIDAFIETDEDPANQYKAYARAWSLFIDAVILWDGLQRGKGDSQSS
jgi:exopolysaccharide production protein ExoY